MNHISINDHWKELIAPYFNPDAITDIQLIHTGGSDRRFYRLTTETGSFILQETGNLVEFRDYTRIGRFLHENNVGVPRMIAVNSEKGILMMEDAGQTDIYSVALHLLKAKNYMEIVGIYKKVLDSLTELQTFPRKALPSAVASRCFDFLYYRWETDYFIDNCIGVRFGITDYDKKGMTKEMEALAESLSGEPAFMVHRDFQSQNIYLKDGVILFLDFQSSRLGSMFYDVASLLKDPYVELPGEVQEELFEYYFNLIGSKNIRNFTEYAEAKEIYNRVALQRLMQALGAYGNLGINKGKPAFLQYVAPALRLLELTLDQVEGFVILKGLTKQMRGAG